MTTPADAGAYVVRHATPADLAGVVRLCHLHAEYEQAAPPPPDLAERLHQALFAERPALRCVVLTCAGDLVGYATLTVDFSTWYGDRFLHLDCLFVDAAHRRGGWGGRLLDAVLAVARSL